MRSVKMKVIVLVLSCVMASSFLIGGTSIINSRAVVGRDSVEILNLLCDNKANDINNLLNTIEKSVETLVVFAGTQITDVDSITNDSKYFEQYNQRILDVAINAAQNTEGARTVYVRFNPQIWDSQSGFFYQRNDDTKQFEKLPPTNLDLYTPNDIKYVGWYYLPVHAGHGIWMDPYMNENIDREIISYVVPFYVDNTLIGVVGMDVDFSVLEDIVASTHVYDTGYAFLTNENAKITYHKKLQRGNNLLTYNNKEVKKLGESLKNNDSNNGQLLQYTFEKTDKKATFRLLSNNMRFVISVPSSEVDAEANNLLLQIIISTMAILAIIVVLTIVFTKRLVRPLLELTEASKKIANGDLRVSITHQSNDEVGVLAESFRQTVVHLDKYFEYVNTLAYKDSLTGLKNKTAYLQAVTTIEKEIDDKMAQFAVIVFDINGLKEVNDTYGHQSGDILIINACKIICNIFEKIPVYRIGGDEFVVILQDGQSKQSSKLLSLLDHEVAEFNQQNDTLIKVSIARGCASYTSTDESYNDVFKKADDAMYIHKAQIKNKINK